MPARHLIMLTPAGPEGFLAQMAAAKLRVPEDFEQISKVAGRYGLRFTGCRLSEPSQRFFWEFLADRV